MTAQVSLPTRGSDVGRENPLSGFDGADGRRDGPGRTRPIAGQPLSTALALRGLVALLFGVLTLLWPKATTVLALALAFGAYAVVDGAGRVGSALRHEAGQERLRAEPLLAGFAGLLAGLMTLLWPQITGLALVMLVGAWAIITGLFEVTGVVTGLLEVPSALRPRAARTGHSLLGVAGIISVVAGMVVLLRPDSGAAALATVLGIYAVITGVVLLAAAWALRNKHIAVGEVR